MTRICVTGASGRAGRSVVAELMEHGHLVVATDLVAPDLVAPDLVAPAEDLGIPVLRADLTDYGQAVEVLAGTDAVVHLANIPAPDLRTPAVTFNENITMNFNVFTAAARLRLGRVVWASSETTLGLPFDVPPRYAPVDEDHYPVPTTTYALSKVASETIAGTSRSGRASRSSGSDSRTSSGRVTTRNSPPTGRIRSCGSGTCGATSMSATPPRRAGSRLTPPSRAAPASSSPRRTRS
jgi:nucleoside-diphosphate-sugar epimerase